MAIFYVRQLFSCRLNLKKEGFVYTKETIENLLKVIKGVRYGKCSIAPNEGGVQVSVL